MKTHFPFDTPSSQPNGQSQRCTKKKRRSPDDTSRYCSSKVIAPSGCKQSPRDRGGKN
ncbi:hypothetical protein C8Q73DRAFT_146672 [Cubamyces lactineus]|nr:hypothetical protein C8Q73DRAFT_146672 [Cubamyces lactineus]